MKTRPFNDTPKPVCEVRQSTDLRSLRQLMVAGCRLAGVMSLLAATLAQAAPVDNFVLLDERGAAHELYYQSDVAAVAIMTHSVHCPTASTGAYRDLAQAWSDHGVRFFLLNADDGSDRAALAAADTGVPILQDDTQIIARGLSFKNVGELIVLDTRDWSVIYRGPADKATASLEAVTTGSATTPVSAAVDGCRIDYRLLQTDISYSDTIAPLLKEHCAYCHVPGGIAPWAMTSYTMVRGFAPMMREVIRTKRMPPWHADPHIGSWEGDRSLSVSDTRTLVQWIEAGAPRGAGADPLENLAPLNNAWPLGTPDLVIDIPGFEVPASGVVDYQFPYVKNELDHGVWVKAATVLPGDRRVVHHVLAGSIEGDIPPSGEDSVMDNYIIGYAPGAETYVMPEGTGVYVAPGGYFTFQLHYTPTGKAVVDESRMGLYLSEQAPHNYLRNTVIVSPTISIPPNTAAHEEAAYYQFSDEVIIHTLFPHSHYRGRSSTFEVRYPDGRQETVLSVPNYDFNWQRGYNPTTPLVLPAGSRLIHRTVYDNSSRNPSNPDPEKQVGWGLQSWDEMLYGAVSYSLVNETTEHPILDKQRSEVTQLVGFLDKNMDGKVSWRELPQRMKKQLVQGFSTVDGNGDGGLDIDEFLVMQRQRQTSENRQNSRAQPAAAD